MSYFFFPPTKKKHPTFSCKAMGHFSFPFLGVLMLIVFPSVSYRMGLKTSFSNQFGGNESSAW